MLQSGFWSPVTYDYGATGTRPPMNLGLQAQLDLQNNQNQQQKDILGQQQGFAGQQSALDRALQQAMQGSQQAFTGQQSALDRALQTSMQAANLGFQGTQAGLNRDFQGTQAGLDRQQAKDLQASQLANNVTIAGMPIEFQREKFNQLFPMISGAIGSAMGGAGGGGAMSPSAAQMAPGSVYTPGQIDQNVNAMKAGNAQQAATQQRQNAASNAAGGFGASSPLLAALNNQAAMGAMQANTSGERDMRLQAAEANAKQGLGAASANNQARAQFEANAIDAQRNQLNARSSLIAALAGMI